jgi:RNA polymerase sigma-70 factor (ECF subfamily)
MTSFRVRAGRDTAVFTRDAPAAPFQRNESSRPEVNPNALSVVISGGRMGGSAEPREPTTHRGLCSEDSSRFKTFDEYRALMFSIAYRMLGSVTEAEDILQEAFLRWCQAGDVEFHSPRAFLVTIVSRLCINHLQSARVRREKYVGQWLPEPIVTQGSHDPSRILAATESLSMAFLLLLERLTPTERAVFLLREVFEYEYSQIAEIVGQTEVNCRQVLRRARQHLRAGGPRFEANSETKQALLSRFLEATSTGNPEQLVLLLQADVVLYADGGGKGLAVPNRLQGADKIARGVLGGLDKLVPRDLVQRIVRVNGEPGVIRYHQGRPFSVLTLHCVDEKIQAIYLITNPDKFRSVPGIVDVEAANDSNFVTIA